jgi:hypothetical protein
MAYLTGLGTHSSYVVHVLPALIVMGIGFGLIFAPAISTATLGVREADSGVASAMVNVSQQIGGSIGTALLSTIAVTATKTFATSHVATLRAAAVAHASPAHLAALKSGLLTQAAIHGYTTAFAWSAAIFALGAVVSVVLLESRRGSVAEVAEEASMVGAPGHASAIPAA